MKTIYHAAASRGHANHGWLDSYHTFSFAGYNNPERIHFGVLRVLNDDTIQGGTGFGKHPHNNMEIISVPLSGKLQHGDDMGNSGIIEQGEIQVMSAGTGIYHSEMNGSNTEEAKFLQIWVFPRQKNLEPRYGQMLIADEAKPNDFQQIISPNKDDAGLWINQDAWFHLADFEKGFVKDYNLKLKSNGVYLFVIEGEVKVGEQVLSKRDGYGISEIDAFTLEAIEASKVLLMEVPMELPSYLF